MTSFKKLSAFALALLLLVSVFSACTGSKSGDTTATTTTTADHSEDDTPARNYYTEEIFQSIKIGESTFRDVYEIAPTETMQVTSYGGFCEYAMENGGSIRIKFVGEDLVVDDIEVISLAQ